MSSGWPTATFLHIAKSTGFSVKQAIGRVTYPSSEASSLVYTEIMISC